MNKFIARFAFILLLVCASRAPAQVKVGDNLSLKLDGSLSAGYTGDYDSWITQVTPPDLE